MDFKIVLVVALVFTFFGESVAQSSTTKKGQVFSFNNIEQRKWLAPCQCSCKTQIAASIHSSVQCLEFGQLRCYACGFSSVDSDHSCLTITNSTHSVDCPFAYCTILRQEFLDPAGVIASFSRGCDDHPDFLNHEITDSTFRTFYRACTNDLCNIGNGIQSVVGGNLSPTPVLTGINLRVPGTAPVTDGATTLRISLVMLLTIMLLYCL